MTAILNSDIANTAITEWLNAEQEWKIQEWLTAESDYINDAIADLHFEMENLVTDMVINGNSDDKQLRFDAIAKELVNFGSKPQFEIEIPNALKNSAEELVELEEWLEAESEYNSAVQQWLVAETNYKNSLTTN